MEKFESVDVALRVFEDLNKKGDIDSKVYISVVKFLKSKGYIMSGVGLQENDKSWSYRALRSRIYTMRSFNTKGCEKCVDEELHKGWHIPLMKKDTLQRLKGKEGTDRYLF